MGHHGQGHQQQQQHHHGLLHHLPSFGRKDSSSSSAPPKGWMAIRVGQEGEEQQRFVVPVMYLNHPLFIGLLKEAEEEYGFDHKGAITIPCHVDHFLRVQGIIEGAHGDDKVPPHHHHHHHHGHHGHGHGFYLGCFGGLKA